MRGTGMSRAMLLLIALLLPLPSTAAETVRLKYSTSVYADEKGNGLNQPEGVACGEDRFIVADSENGRAVLYTLKGGDPSGGKEIKIPQLVYPVRAAVNSKGEFFVLDGRSHKIVRLNADGTFNRYQELGGLPAEGPILAAGIAVDGRDNLAVLDIASGRVVVFDADGKFQQQVAFPKDYGFITDLTMTAQGTIFLVDSVAAKVYSNAKDPAAFAPITASLKDDLKFAAGITTDSTGAIYVSDQNSGGIVLIGQDGTLRSRQLGFGWKESGVRYPTQICIDKSGNLFIADRANSRVQEFALIR